MLIRCSARCCVLWCTFLTTVSAYLRLNESIKSFCTVQQRFAPASHCLISFLNTLGYSFHICPLCATLPGSVQQSCPCVLFCQSSASQTVEVLVLWPNDDKKALMIFDMPGHQDHIRYKTLLSRLCLSTANNSTVAMWVLIPLLDYSGVKDSNP